MYIQPITNNYNYLNSKRLKPSGVKTTPAFDTVSFTAHTNVEKCSKKGISVLIHQTAHNREPETLNIVCDYAKKLLEKKDKIKIISGGCSTGEEAVSMSMKLYNKKNKVDILGIDLGKKAIEKANSRKFILEVPKDENMLNEFFISPSDSPYTDSYLVKSKDDGLTAEQLHFKTLFKEFFRPTGKIIKPSLHERFYNLIQKRANNPVLELDRIEYELKPNMADNCKFIQGDIRNIDKILNGEKTDIILFRNSLYHIATEGYDSYMRKPKKNAEVIIENLMTKFKESLSKDGIIAFGEKEGEQLLDKTILPKVMRKLGFKPLNDAKHHKSNIWKVSE